MSDFDNKAEDLGGKAKEAAGNVSGNDDLANEGKADQVKAGAKDKIQGAVDGAKDKANEIIGGLKD